MDVANCIAYVCVEKTFDCYCRMTYASYRDKSIGFKYPKILIQKRSVKFEICHTYIFCVVILIASVFVKNTLQFIYFCYIIVLQGRAMFRQKAFSLYEAKIFILEA